LRGRTSFKKLICDPELIASGEGAPALSALSVSGWLVNFSPPTVAVIGGITKSPGWVGVKAKVAETVVED